MHMHNLLLPYPLTVNDLMPTPDFVYEAVNCELRALKLNACELIFQCIIMFAVFVMPEKDIFL